MVGTTTVTLVPNGKTVANLVSINGLGNTAGKRGALTITAPGGAVAVTAQRFNGGAFSSIPVTQN
jgi:hypothetical protein